MRDTIGTWLVIGGTVVGVLTALFLRERLPTVIVLFVLVASGVAIGAGGLLVQGDVSRVNWVLTLLVLGVIVPAHVRIVLGPLGRARDERVTG